MAEIYTVSLSALIQEHKLTKIHMPDGGEDILIERTDVNRPGLSFAGYYHYYESKRVQIIGNAEYNYLLSMEYEKRCRSIDEFFSTLPVCVIFTNNLPVLDEILETAKKYSVPILGTYEKTSPFMAAVISFLNLELAPRITRHGVFVEVYGEGVLMFGDSGIGKSETAIELVKRGHRLVADDAVELKKVSAITLVGSAPEVIRHYVELRGIGIIDVRRIFGMGAVKPTEKVDLVVNLETWVQGKLYERWGLETEYFEILGINVPSVTIPVKPGRNLAVIIEIAAMNNRQKKMGYNTAVEFSKKLMGQLDVELDR